MGDHFQSAAIASDRDKAERLAQGVHAERDLTSIEVRNRDKFLAIGHYDRRSLIGVGKGFEYGHVLIECQSKCSKNVNPIPKAEEVLQLPRSARLPEAASLKQAPHLVA